MKKQYFVINTQKDNYPLEPVDRKEFMYWFKNYCQKAMDKNGNIFHADNIKFADISSIYNPQGILIGEIK